MTAGNEFRHSTRSKAFCWLAGATMLAALAGCVEKGAGEGGPAISGATPRPAAASPATREPSLSAAVGQTCTQAWRERGHTNQRQAQIFLTRCLADQGVVELRMRGESVLAIAATVVPANSPLTALVPGDIADFCPGYVAAGTEGRADFWRTFITAIARPESDFRTTASLWEAGGLNQFSIGLLQLSYTDRAYGCDFKNEADIADPRRNLACGVRILDRLVGRSGVIGGGPGAASKGAAAYWSTLRTSSSGRAEVVGATSALSACLRH